MKLSTLVAGIDFSGESSCISSLTSRPARLASSVAAIRAAPTRFYRCSTKENTLHGQFTLAICLNYAQIIPEVQTTVPASAVSFSNSSLPQTRHTCNRIGRRSISRE